MTFLLQFCYLAEQIGNVANWKRHQRLDEIFMFFTHTTLKKSAKLFSKNSVMQYARKT